MSLPIPLYIPNILCYIRIILAVTSIHTAAHISDSDTPFQYICITSILWIIASVLDHIDGKVARYCNQCSQFGVFLDIIADNILRGSAWMCVVLATASSQHGTLGSCEIEGSDGSSDGSSTGGSTWMVSLAPILGLFFISIEWMTMISSQMLTLLKEKQHWKDIGQRSNQNESFQNTDKSSAIETEPPKFVQWVFANNFYNFFGVLAMYGLFSVGMIQFLYIHRCIIFQVLPMLRIPLYLALVISYIGRLFALCTELWLCYQLMKIILDESRTKKKVT